VVPTPPADELFDEVRRLADHLRRLPESRLRRRHDELAGETAADAARALAQWLADAEGALGPADGRPARLPQLSDLAVGDMVAVTGQDLVAAVRRRPDVDVDLVSDAVSRLRRLRRVS
jgi:hypothetical protein